ncbi:DUF4476 domain-containing protein [Taibaiella soli]|uniref:DUF4476 domain-containing protein n=1 Tax=Taibaiella soli TaxID=1649169 RepID=A0A2W2BBI8_9BACT|nr:DUF4476 domain-containing protein [Taibaiella soli]PZF71006.1 hypothetical protein DN068_20090 [Taibaiella soli]
MLKTFLSKQLLFLLVFAFSITELAAQSYSYIYIQGDKQTPFYVKLEGEMLPRYGKNYCIIPKLVAGEVNIDILFQQNAYPAQHFIVQVPENGYRGFMLTQRNGQFALYDLQQQFYLQAGNAATDDHAPLFNAGQTPTPPPPNVVAAAAVPVATVPSEPAPAANDTPQPAKATQSTTAATQTKPANDGQPKFLDNIELSNDHNTAGNVATAVVAGAAVVGTVAKPASENNADDNKDNASTPATAAPAATDNAPKAAIVNSDCPDPISDATFDAIYQKVMAQSSEEARLGYLNQQIGGCFNTKQVGAFAKTMDSDAARYTLLKKLYPRTTDQANYGNLDALFTDPQWKAYFQQLVKR